MVRLQQKPFLENVISQADYEYLKKCLLRDGKLTYYFAIRIMATTGVRISELLQIRVEDMIRGQMDLYSKGSGGSTFRKMSRRPACCGFKMKSAPAAAYF